jgi:alanine racemase
MRGTRLEINLDALNDNLNTIKSFLKNNEKVIAIVKADAYGLGAVRVASSLKNKVWAFAVATIEEAMELRKSGIENKILMLAPFFENETDDIVKHNITATVTDFKRAKLLSDKCVNENKICDIHIKIDTGMGRLGLFYNECLDEIVKIKTLQNLNIEGLYTHFPSADLLDDKFCQTQIERFDSFTKQLEEKGIAIPVKHIANSSGAVSYPESYKDAVRPGILMYGAYPSEFIKDEVNIKNVATLKAKILFIKEINSGESVSYGRTFTAQQRTRIGVMGIGYADGFSTLNSGKAFVYIDGKFAPILGRVCMDYTMVDLTRLPDVKEEDDVVIFGDGGETIEYYSEKIGIIPYEALTSISKRVERVYLGN